MSTDTLLLQLPLHHDLGGNACVVCPWDPDGVVPAHAVIAGQAVHDGLVESVTHVQGARDVGRRQLYGKARLTLLGLTQAPVSCNAIAATLPFWTPMGLQSSGLK